MSQSSFLIHNYDFKNPNIENEILEKLQNFKDIIKEKNKKVEEIK